MKNILEYQKLDANLMQLEKQRENLPEQVALNKIAVMYREVQSKLKELEDNSGSLINEFNEAVNNFEVGMQETEKLSKTETANLSNEKLNDIQNNANKISSMLFMLERKLNMLLTSINKSLKEFEVLKNKAMTIKSKHGEIKERIEQQKASMQPQIDAYEKELKKLEGTLDKTLFAKYKNLKHDNVFPVFVPLNDKRCGYCRVELPSFKLDKLKNEEFITCEQCGRLIFKNE